jgi:hypothetical protein
MALHTSILNLAQRSIATFQSALNEVDGFNDYVDFQNAIPIIKPESLVFENDPRKSTYKHLPDTPLTLVQSALNQSTAQGYQPIDTRVFRPSEKITGIAQDRPEIILLSDFLPLYDLTHPSKLASKSDQLTDAGLLFDARMNELSINDMTVRTFIDAAISASKNSTLLKNATSQNAYEELMMLATLLRQIVQRTQRTREMLDMRDYRHVVGVANVANRTGNVLSSFQEKVLNPSYKLQDFLGERGFTNVDSFSSTKLLQQSLKEYRTILENCDITYQSQKDDTDPFRLFPQETTFSYNPGAASLPFINDLRKISFDRIDDNSAVDVLEAGWRTLYNSAFLNDVDTLAGRLCLFTQENRYSAGISKTDVQNELSDKFGYVVSSNAANTTAFEAMFGNCTEDVSTIPTVVDDTLLNIAYTRAGPDVAVLNFENSYLSVGTSVITPGSEYYIDSVLETFNQTTKGTNVSLSFDRLKELSNRINTSLRALTIISKGMNFNAEPEAAVRSTTRKRLALDSGVAATSRANYPYPLELVQQLQDTLLENGSLKPEYNASWIPGLFKLNSSRLKTMLFLFSVSQALRNRNDTSDFTIPAITAAQTDLPTTVNETITNTAEVQDRLLVKLLDEAKALINVNYASAVNSTSEFEAYITYDDIKNSFLSGDPLWSTVNSILTSYYTWISETTNVFNVGRTRYRGMIDTAMMMSLFDIVTRFIAKHSDITLSKPPYTRPRLLGDRDASTTLFNVYRTPTSLDTTFSQQIIEKVSFYKKNLLIGNYATIGSLYEINSLISDHIDFFTNENTQRAIDDLRASFPSTIDPRFMRMVFYEQQSMLMSSNLTDTLDIAQNSGQTTALKVYDQSLRISDFKDYCLKVFSDPSFTAFRSNAKIMSVGIPVGFAEHLKGLVKINAAGQLTGNARKQNDIVTISVYKTDVRFPDVIFKPQQFKFELSRFPVRNARLYPAIPKTASLTDVINRIPTRDILQGKIGDADAVQYGSQDISVSQTQSFGDLNKEISVAYSTPDYDFLSANEKAQLLKNHAISFMLELYLKALTDMHVAEHMFYVDAGLADVTVSQDVQEDLLKHVLSYVANTNSMRDQAETPDNEITFRRRYRYNDNVKMGYIDTFTAAAKSINVDISQKTLSEVVSELQTSDRDVINKTINDVLKVAAVHTNLTSTKDVTKAAFAPRQFDRVFNLLVDPDDFEIDIQQTNSTPSGKEALQSMSSEGLIVAKLDASKLTTSNPFLAPTTAFTFTQTNKNNGDFALDKYFVSVSVEEGEGIADPAAAPGLTRTQSQLRKLLL